ncbi:hypothetical protein B0H11DRAFT_2293778 [Mycena galericulata]|nr:hypothetical protein B0H11DRAFT_2293778 [Mycena galericulata]
MASTTTDRPCRSSSSTPSVLCQRIHALERVHGRAFTATTADSSSTRFGDGSDLDIDMEVDGCGWGGVTHVCVAADVRGRKRTGAEDDPVRNPRAWYQPSLPVLLALAPPIGNWLTGGDHVKNLLLLLLLVLYLPQLVEVPWRLESVPCHASVPPAARLRAFVRLYFWFGTSFRRPRPILRSDTSTSITHPPDAQTVAEHDARRADQARVRALARSAPSSSSSSSSSSAHSLTSSPAPPVHPNPATGNGVQTSTPISWFSTALFALLTTAPGELVARVSLRTSTLHTIVHSPSPSPSTFSTHSSSTHVSLYPCGAKGENNAAMRVMETYVARALTPLEDGCRCSASSGGAKANGVLRLPRVVRGAHAQVGKAKAPIAVRSPVTLAASAKGEGKGVGGGGGGGGCDAANCREDREREQ